MFNSREYEYNSPKELKEHFQRYCIECWHRGFGCCDICVKAKNKTMLELKVKEFKANK